MAELKNLRALREIRIKGKPVKEGEVFAKSAFDNKGDWLDLVHMTPPTLEETDDPIGSASKSKKKSEPVSEPATLPGA